jgi:hypothetical protein
MEEEQSGEYVKRVLFRQHKRIETPDGHLYLEATLWKFYRREGETIDAGVIPAVAIWRWNGKSRCGEWAQEPTGDQQREAARFVVDFASECVEKGLIGFQP